MNSPGFQPGVKDAKRNRPRELVEQDKDHFSDGMEIKAPFPFPQTGESLGGCDAIVFSPVGANHE